ncbi:uncharacterized protein I303_102058 [Kwoniella dejecticola CBS 10117]|uniref:Mid2 domain-containing protein n=1 Tax=Kwoniella dejecticola CBS 10117 TaxID=1296121 RepID=A0A1A6AC18_9TREE|nr:uncharacterized protein I303_01803 [Kwoniella dejecticola CBS 10117]OBR87595.1 hypothetical protein I303_01803 [Kwoniella dejecticola CBS 10117]
MRLTPSAGAMTFVITYLMLFSWPHLALAQSSTTARAASSTSPTSSSTTTVYNGVPSLVFGNVPTMTACASGLILFNVYNEDPSKVNITLYAINEGIDQSIPSPSTTSAAASTTAQSARASSVAASTQNAIASSPRPTSVGQSVTSARSSATTAAGPVEPARRDLEGRTILDLNITLVTQYANHGWAFNPVRLPEGRYYISGVVDDDRQTINKSNVFSVVESDDTACLSAFASLSASASAAATGKAGSTTRKITATATASDGALSGGGAESSTEGSEKKGLGGGAIGGIVVGVLAGLAALVLLFFCCRGRRNAHVRHGEGAEEGGFMGMGKGMGIRRFRSQHQKMPSDTNPSEQGHGHGYHNGMSNKDPIAMTPVSIRAEDSYRSDKSDEKRGSLGSTNEDVVEDLPPPHSLPTPLSTAFTTASSGFSSEDHNHHDNNAKEFGRRPSDPFSTPTLGEIPAMSPIYANDEIRRFGPSGISRPNDSIQPPPPVILANVKRSSAEQSPKPSVGLGMGIGPALKSSSSTSSLPYNQPVQKQSKSEPGQKRSSTQSIGVGVGIGMGSPTIKPSTSTSTSTSESNPPDPNTFAIPDTGKGTNTIAGAGLGRSTSSRRKPVPSLGPELRTELARQNSLKDLKGRKGSNSSQGGDDGQNHSPPQEEGAGSRRRSYKLMPDPPIIHE